MQYLFFVLFSALYASHSAFLMFVFPATFDVFVLSDQKNNFLGAKKGTQELQRGPSSIHYLAGSLAVWKQKLHSCNKNRQREKYIKYTNFVHAVRCIAEISPLSCSPGGGFPISSSSSSPSSYSSPGGQILFHISVRRQTSFHFLDS